MRERGLERFADPQSKLEMATLDPVRSARITSSRAVAAILPSSRA